GGRPTSFRSRGGSAQLRAAGLRERAAAFSAPDPPVHALECRLAARRTPSRRDPHPSAPPPTMKGSVLAASLLVPAALLTSACAATSRPPAMPEWAPAESALVAASAPLDMDDETMRIP